MFAFFICKPRSPLSQWSTDTGIIKLFAFGCKIKDIWNKHFRKRLLVIKHILCSISPSYTSLCRRLDLSYDHRNTIDEKNNVKSFASGIRTLRILPLVGHHIAIILSSRNRVRIEKIDSLIVAILAKGETIFVKEKLP